MKKMGEFLDAYDTYKKNSKELISKIEAHNHTATEAKTPPFLERIFNFLNSLRKLDYSLADLTKELLADGNDTILKALNDYEDASFLWDGKAPASMGLSWTKNWPEITGHPQKCKKDYDLENIMSKARKAGECNKLLRFIEISMYEKKLGLSKKERDQIKSIFELADKVPELYNSLSDTRVEFLKLMLQRIEAGSDPLFRFLGSRVIMLEFLLGLDYDEIVVLTEAAHTKANGSGHEVRDQYKWQLLTQMFEKKHGEFNELMQHVKNPKGFKDVFKTGNGMDKIRERYYDALNDKKTPQDRYSRSNPDRRKESLKPVRDKEARKAILIKHLTVNQLTKFRRDFQSIVRDVERFRENATKEEKENQAQHRHKESQACGNWSPK